MNKRAIPFLFPKQPEVLHDQGVLYSTTEPHHSVLSKRAPIPASDLGQVLLQQVQLSLPLIIILFPLKNNA